MQNFFTENQKKWLAKIIIISICFLGIFLLFEAISVIKGLSYIGRSSTPGTITITGTGQVFAIPDIATFSFTVSETAKTVADAQNQASQKINAAISALKTFGIADADIKTTSYNSYPTYSYTNYPCPLNAGTSAIYPCRTGKQTITGYQVSQTIEVKIRKTDIAGDVLAKMGSLNVSDISGLDFTVDNPDALQAEARDKAIADARAKAGGLSKALGVHLDKVVNFVENVNQPIYFNALNSQAAPAAAPQIPTGQNMVTSNVSITYEVD